MIGVALLIVSAVLWQERFVDGVSSMNQLYDYTVDIVHEGEKVLLQAVLQEDEYAAAWFSSDVANPFPEHARVRLLVKVNSNTVRLRLFCRRHGHSVYFTSTRNIAASEHWQTIEVSLHDTRPFYSSNFPASLTPGREPALFLIIENAHPGLFNMEIDDILVLEQQEE
jgi:hypothetical protein